VKGGREEIKQSIWEVWLQGKGTQKKTKEKKKNAYEESNHSNEGKKKRTRLKCRKDRLSSAQGRCSRRDAPRYQGKRKALRHHRIGKGGKKSLSGLQKKVDIEECR